VWPTDGLAPPNASTLNVVAGRTVPNLAIVKVGPGGEISLFNEQGQTHLLVDVVGWFPSSFDLDPPALAPAVLNEPLYSFTLGTVRASGPVQFGFFDTAPGLSGSAAGTVSGSPTVAGTYSTLVVAADAGGAGVVRFLPHIVFGADDEFTRVAKHTLYDSFPAAGRLVSGTQQTFTAGGVGGVPPTAEAVVLSVQAQSPSAGFLTVWQDGTSQPDTSALFMPAGERVNNVIVVPLSALGRFVVANFGAADYRLDILGYFASASPYSPVTPTRIADSRVSIGLSGPLAPGTTVTLAVSTSVVPADADSVILSVSTTGAAGGGSLDVVPAGTAPQSPTTMDFGTDNQTQTVVVPLSTGNAIDIRNRTGGAATHVIVDVLGYIDVL
jgi:hypothetical protein